jgi:putative transposase
VAFGILRRWSLAAGSRRPSENRSRGQGGSRDQYLKEILVYWRRKPSPGLIHHSDRGIQYACERYQEQLEQFHMVPSMSRKGDCWDNAPTERFFRSLKYEHLLSCRPPTREAAKRETLEYITFYNAYRLHSTLGYQSPMEFERTKLLKAA